MEIGGFKVEISDEDLLARLRNEEDHFVERKTVSDLNDCVKTVVAFANSAPFGMPGVLYVGVRDDGRFEEKEIDFDSIQKSVNNKLKSIYPRVPYFPKILSDGENRVLAIIVPGSHQRPHFSGPSYVRVGSESVEASAQQYDNLVAQRSSKVFRISQHMGQPVSVEIKFEHTNRTFSRATWDHMDLKITDCNESWVTLTAANGEKHSFPLSAVELSHDGRRLRMEVTRVTG